MTTIRSQIAANWFQIVGPFLLGALLFALPLVALVFVFSLPDRWDRATVVRICRDGTKVFRMEDGEVSGTLLGAQLSCRQRRRVRIGGSR